MKSKYIIIALIALSSLAFGASESVVWSDNLVDNILGYDKKGSLHLGQYFTILQSTYFKPLFLGVLFGVPAVFLLHYMVIGPMIFSHDRKKIYVFTLFHRIVHAIAGVSFILLIPTGLIMMFASTFGGGEFVRVCKEIHAISTLLFIVSIVPMFFMWLRWMFLHFDDIKWLMIVGGYLNKDKKPVPAGRFNAGQKTWYWLATLGGFIMIGTGAAMYFQDFRLDMLDTYQISQIDFLRASAIVHNALGLAVVALFFVHIYMAVFAIKGAIHSMIDGHKEEEEVEILHSSYYRELKEKGEV
ncbi:formate dehydrogenase, gamma subunit [Sulfurimonas gotlandica GD1]|uniref:Formate dehydrogenase, gamma subunit n=1 Tax=Sulfurimonas gotlandica (strain DSM 19862 / JCM 16533 / GD1) TaxID=929558 RepID=B6BLJ2_SULGG|nr:formate dehydrogenase subunit gamma [Sulfurimonas gotlandica]EDZ61950.1 formate dehydrogenase, gamma subunit [Sulfurimonas gotlandica GD1]EHP28649.1 formate dehydrogenase, gamma subunit [Sulfurimonas gotlandica GD1]